MTLAQEMLVRAFRKVAQANYESHATGIGRSRTDEEVAQHLDELLGYTKLMELVRPDPDKLEEMFHDGQPKPH